MSNCSWSECVEIYPLVQLTAPPSQVCSAGVLLWLFSWLPALVFKTQSQRGGEEEEERRGEERRGGGLLCFSGSRRRRLCRWFPGTELDAAASEGQRGSTRHGAPPANSRSARRSAQNRITSDPVRAQQPSGRLWGLTRLSQWPPCFLAPLKRFL